MSQDKSVVKPKKSGKQAEKNQELIDTASRISNLWMEFRKCLRMAFTTKPVTREQEQGFLDLKSGLARLQRSLAQRMPEGFRYGSKGMHDLMGSSISIATLRELPTNDKKQLYIRWHEAHIALQHLMGILDLLAEGYPVRFEALKKKTGNLKEDIGLSGDGKQKSKKKSAVVFLIVVIALGVGAWLYMSKT
ncbi:hypothetical protein HQ520_01035 [bacterium]|nr:hypothetical protein [bacterium]